MIKAIDTTSIHRICSSQVVVDLATAVKELVENSLDAGATVVEIALVEYGESLIEVHDNAKGIDPEDYEGLAMKHHTSKIEQFEDLMNVSSYGFRGEALNSLCELSESFVVTTRRESDPAATKLTFDRMGRLKGQSHASRGIGTTVSIENLFQSLPVRRAEYIRYACRSPVHQYRWFYCLFIFILLETSRSSIKRCCALFKPMLSLRQV
jgi:DNA mismatch repair protein PMS2